MSSATPPDPEQQTLYGQTSIPVDAEGTVAGAGWQRCASCGAPLEPGASFCQACGASLEGSATGAGPESGNQPGGTVEVPSERQRRWLPLITVLWLVVMVAALVALFTFLFGLSF